MEAEVVAEAEVVKRKIDNLTSVKNCNVKIPQNPVPQIPRVAGCLGRNAAYWRRLFPGSLATKVVERGYRPQFEKRPPLAREPFYMVPKAGQQHLIAPALEELIQKGALEVVFDHTSPGWYS